MVSEASQQYEHDVEEEMFNEIIPGYQLTIDKILKTGVTLFPNNEIVYWPPNGRRLHFTFKEFNERVNRLGWVLEELGVVSGNPRKMGTRVAIFDWNTHRFLELLYAVPMYGAVLQPVNIRLAPEEIVYVMNKSKDEIAFVNADFLPLIKAVAPKLEYLRKIVVMHDGEEPINIERIDKAEVYDYEELMREAREFNYPEELDEKTVMVMMYTSGTTGLPKATIFRHREIVLHAIAVLIIAVWSWYPVHYLRFIRNAYNPLGVPSLLLVPFYHVLGWGAPYYNIMGGTPKIVLPGRYDWNHIVKLIKEEGVKNAGGVPTMLYLTLSSPELKDVDLRGFLWSLGGAAATKGLIEEARKRGVILVNGYGMTETAPVVIVPTLPPDLMAGLSEEQIQELIVNSIGKPLPFVQARVVDEYGRDVPRDGKTVGELVLRAPWITLGYYGDPEKTREAFRDGWFHTGDLATWDERGFIYIVDRAKDVIKSGGEWISSLKLESIISLHPAVAEVAVIGATHEKWGERPVAIVVPRPGQRVTEDDIKKYLMQFVDRGEIPKWWIPDRIVFVDELPKTGAAKIDKKALRERYRDILIKQGSQ